jgi:hypothetical protein
LILTIFLKGDLLQVAFFLIFRGATQAYPSQKGARSWPAGRLLFLAATNGP